MGTSTASRPNRKRAVAAIVSMHRVARKKPVRNDNPNHDEKGRFGEGSGSGASTAGKDQSLKDRVKATVTWLRSAPAQEVISTVATSHATKEVMTFAIGSLIAHGLGSSGGGFWYQEPTLEHDIATTVHNLSAHLQVTSGRAKEMVSTVIGGLKSMRSEAGKKSAKAKSQRPLIGFHAADEELLPTMEHLQAILDALDKLDVEADDNAAK